MNEKKHEISVVLLANQGSSALMVFESQVQRVMEEVPATREVTAMAIATAESQYHSWSFLKVVSAKPPKLERVQRSAQPFSLILVAESPLKVRV